MEHQQPEGFCEEDRWAELCHVGNKSLGNDNSVMFLSATYKENGAAAHGALLTASVWNELNIHLRKPRRSNSLIQAPKKSDKFIRVSTNVTELLQHV